MDLDLLIALTTFAIVITLTEFLFWRLFRQRITPIIFPKSKDASMLRFFTITRMRFFAAMHTIFLLIVVVFSLLLLW